MIVKSNYSGPGMGKYGFFAMAVKVAIIVAWFYFAVIPQGGDFLDFLQESLNTQVWNLKELLWPLGQIFLYAVASVIFEYIIGFITLKIAMAEHGLKF